MISPRTQPGSFIATSELPARRIDLQRMRVRTGPELSWRELRRLVSGEGLEILDELPGTELVFTARGARGARGDGAREACRMRVDPDGWGGAWITRELRAVDPKGARLRKTGLLRPGAWRNLSVRLGEGASIEETLPFPMDERIASPRVRRTLSTTIEAPPSRVWPWLMQMGCRRGGWYTYDRLDNGGVPSADEVIPGLQQLRVGDLIPWKPDGRDGYTVLALAEEEFLVLGSASLLDPFRHPDSLYVDTWTFMLEPIGAEATRLMTRIRADYPPGWQMSVLSSWLRFVHGVMGRAQLRHLKRRIETREARGLTGLRSGLRSV